MMSEVGFTCRVFATHRVGVRKAQKRSPAALFTGLRIPRHYDPQNEEQSLRGIHWRLAGRFRSPQRIYIARPRQAGLERNLTLSFQCRTEQGLDREIGLASLNRRRSSAESPAPCFTTFATNRNSSILFQFLRDLRSKRKWILYHFATSPILVSPGGGPSIPPSRQDLSSNCSSKMKQPDARRFWLDWRSIFITS